MNTPIYLALLAAGVPVLKNRWDACVARSLATDDVVRPTPVLPRLEAGLASRSGHSALQR